MIVLQILSIDLKEMISLLALIIAIVSLIWTIINQCNQNRKWDNLNIGNPGVFEIKLKNWKELSKEEAMNTKWGYDPSIYGKSDSIDGYILPYSISIRSAQSNELIPNTNPVFSILEVNEELKRIDCKEQVNLFRLFKPIIWIENMGKTEVRNLMIYIDAEQPNNEWVRAFTSNARINLAGAKISTVYFDFELSLDSKIPDQLRFKIYFSYEDCKKKKKKKIIGVKWTSQDNIWSYEDVEE